jgi:hypothetical protein
MSISVASVSSFLTQDTVSKDGKFNSVTENGNETLNSDTCTFKFEINPVGRNPAKNGQCDVESNNGYEVEVPAEKAEYVITTIENLDKAYEQSDNPKEKMRIFEEKLQVLREVGVLPPSFTTENITKTSEWLMDRVSGKSQDSSKNYNSIKFLNPIIGLGVGLICVVPFGEVVYLPVPFTLYWAVANSSVIPILHLANNWTLSLNFTTTYSLASVATIFSHSAFTWGWCFTILPPSSNFIMGPFYSLWGGVAGFSITVYGEWYPKIILLDFCIFGGATAVIVPFVNCGVTQ